MSSEIAWAVTRNNSAYLLKKRNCPKPFSTDPFNLTNKNSFRYNGFLHKKAVAVAPTADKKGVTLTLKKSSMSYRPGKRYNRSDLKKGARVVLTTIRNTLNKQRYRKDLSKAALRRASALIRAQKPLPARKGAKPVKKAE